MGPLSQAVAILGSYNSEFNLSISGISSLLVSGTNTLYINATDGGGPSGLIFSATIETVAAESTTVALDIMPQSCPNPLNAKSKGVLPVAILGTRGTPDFDVSTIDTFLP